MISFFKIHAFNQIPLLYFCLILNWNLWVPQKHCIIYFYHITKACISITRTDHIHKKIITEFELTIFVIWKEQTQKQNWIFKTAWLKLTRINTCKKKCVDTTQSKISMINQISISHQSNCKKRSFFSWCIGDQLYSFHIKSPFGW